jgi:hypothetical protein
LISFDVVWYMFKYRMKVFNLLALMWNAYFRMKSLIADGKG